MTADIQEACVQGLSTRLEVDLVKGMGTSNGKTCKDESHGLGGACCFKNIEFP